MSSSQPSTGTVPRGNRYEHVQVLLLSWEQDDADSPKVKRQLENMQEQLSQLKRVFQYLYNFGVEAWKIPRSSAFRTLGRKLSEFEETYNDPKHLLIIYYGGHGAVSGDRKAIWKCYDSNDSPKVDWYSLQATFLSDDTAADVLMFIDCCRAGSAVRAPVTESLGNIVYVLAASGFDNDAPLSGPTTFTANLIAELALADTYTRGARVDWIATSVLNRLSDMRLPDGSTGVTSVPYVLRAPFYEDRMIRLMRHQPIDLEQAQPHPPVESQPQSSLRQTSAMRGDSPVASIESIDGHLAQPTAIQDFESEQASVAVPIITRDSTYQLVDAVPDLRKEDDVLIDVPANAPASQSSSADLQFLRSLFYPEMQSRTNAIKEAHAETFQWIYKADEFKSWLEGGQGIFWISGKAGSGKSTLMKAMAKSKPMFDTLADSAEPKSVEIVSFMFWNAGTALEKSLSGLYRSLLFQILEKNRSLIPYIEEQLQASDGYVAGAPWVVSQLEQAFVIVLAQYFLDGPHLCLLIDGLDEFAGNHTELIAMIKRWTSRWNIKACVASRPWGVFQRAFMECPSIRLQDLTQNDIQSYVRSELMAIGLMRFHSSEIEIAELIEEITRRSNGVFLWVYLVIRSIAQGFEGQLPKDILRRIQAFPQDLEDTFQHILNRTENAYGQRASRIFQVLHASQIRVVDPVAGTVFEPLLTTLGLHFALLADPMVVLSAEIRALDRTEVLEIERQISNMLQVAARGLLLLEKTTHDMQMPGGLGSRITYMHKTVHDFLEDTAIATPMPSISTDDFDADLKLLGSIVLQLKAFDFGVRQKGMEDSVHELGCWSLVEQGLSCAARVKHCQALYLIRYLDELDKTMTFQMEIWHCSDDHWSSLFPSGRPKTEHSHDTFLSLAITFSVLPYAEAKISETPSLVASKRGRPLLDYALLASASVSSMSGLVDPMVVSLLLQHGADPNATFADESIWARFLEMYFQRYDFESKITDKTERLLQVHDMLVSHGADAAVAYRLAFRRGKSLNE